MNENEWDISDFLPQRGKLRSIESGSQVCDFSGLRWDNITPTDVDGFLEFRGKLFVFLDAKYNGTAAPRGQRLAFERVCDVIQSSCKADAVTIFCSHQTAPPTPIPVAGRPVTEYYFRGTWSPPATAGLTVKELIDEFLARHFIVKSK